MSITSKAHPVLPGTGWVLPHRHCRGLCQTRSRADRSPRHQELTAGLPLSPAAPPLRCSSAPI